jgi:hypothetical protein
MKISLGAAVVGVFLVGLGVGLMANAQQPPAPPDAVSMEIGELKARIAGYEANLPKLRATEAATQALLATDRATLAGLEARGRHAIGPAVALPAKR